MKRCFLLLLCIIMICSCIINTVYAASEVSASAGGIETFSATLKGSRDAGAANQSTSITERKATEAELAQRAVDEMGATFGDDWENYQDPNENLMDLSAFDALDISAGVLPEYSFSDLEVSAGTPGAMLVTDQAGNQHYVTDSGLKQKYEKQNKEAPAMGSDPNSGIFVVAEDLDMPNIEAFDYAMAVKNLDDTVKNTLDPNDISYEPEFTVTAAGLASLLWRVQLEKGIEGSRDTEALGNLNSHGQYMAEYMNNMKDWISNEKGYKFGSNDPLNNFTSYAQAMRLQDYLNGAADIMTVGRLSFVMPKQNGTLYRSLLSYIKMLEGLGQHTMRVKKYTIYQATSYKVQAFKSYTPAMPIELRWNVKDPSGTTVAEKTSDKNFIQVLFRGPGTYEVSVFQKSNVVRHNYVTGYKTEVWTLSNNDIFDGLVLYNHTSVIGGFQSDDIGPKLEELRLTDQGFTANVSPDQASKTAIIDDRGFVHAAGSQFNTERIDTDAINTTDDENKSS